MDWDNEDVDLTLKDLHLNKSNYDIYFEEEDIIITPESEIVEEVEH